MKCDDLTKPTDSVLSRRALLQGGAATAVVAFSPMSPPQVFNTTQVEDTMTPVQSCLALAPVVFRAPIAGERLNRRELYALSRICDRLSFRPLCIVDAPAQFGKFRLRNIHMERPNGVLVGFLFTDI
jgi:hypothetical protein